MTAQQKQVSLLRIFLKDLSFESPQSPQIFNGQNAWNPEVRVNLQVQHKNIDNGIFEVSLELTVEGVKDEAKMFIVEVEQAGIFRIEGLDQGELNHALGVFCPNILFPYARQVIDQALVGGSFPPLMLAPINFEAIFAQHANKPPETRN